MAKIALVSRTASSQALGLAQALHLQRHEVIFITGHNQIIDTQVPFKVLTFFKSWSLLEAVRFLPRLISHAPEILHIVISEKNPRETSVAALMLASFIKSLPNRLVALTSYGPPSLKQRLILKPLLRMCDIVTFGTREVLMYHKRNGDLKGNGVTEVLPPLIDFAPSTLPLDQEKKQDLVKLTEKLHPFFIIPTPILNREESWFDFAGNYNFVVLGPRPDHVPSGKFFFVGDNTKNTELDYILKASSGIYLASENFSVLELMQFRGWALHHGLAVFASQRQTEAVPGLCIHDKNGWLVTGLKHFEQLLQSKTRPKIEINPAADNRSSLVDSTLNELSRLYAKAFEQKLSNPL